MPAENGQLRPSTDHVTCFLSYFLRDLRENECYFFGAYNATNNVHLNRIEPFHEYKSSVGGYFDRADHLRYECLRLYHVNGFLSINPVNRNKMRYGSNRAGRIKGDQGAKDEDVTRLAHVFVDIDSIRSKGHQNDSATHGEREAAIALRDVILADHLPHFDIETTGLYGTSGNGAWILARLPDLPNDDRHRKLVQSMLLALSARYDTPLARIDTATYNPARVMAVAGTWKCKGPNTPDRPWRLATVDGGCMRP